MRPPPSAAASTWRCGAHISVAGATSAWNAHATEAGHTELGARSKIPHLSYIGDATVGEDTNIGAGNITANYDGASKHYTTIGDRVRTGSDCVFVAPVAIGDDATTGAGSIITEDVPAEALGIARARQVNKEHYAKRKRDV